MDFNLYESRILALEKLSITDDTTGLRNKRSFKIDFNELYNSRKSIRFKYLAILDIDNFKKYNDTFGYIFGDGLLKSLSDELLKINMLCESQIDLYRWGGEEFTLIFHNISKSQLILNLNNIINNNVCNVSIGVSKFIKTPDETFKFANNALLKAKSSGKNCFFINK